MANPNEKRKSSLWVRDINVEGEIAKFLDQYFYEKVVEDFYRFKSKEDQLKGKDVKFTWEGLNNIIVDEKAISHYINRNIPTFAFEISSNNGKSRGWLFDSDKETGYYLCIWIWASKNWNPAVDEIVKLECLLIKREDIIDYLINQGFTEELIFKKEKYCIENELSGAIEKGEHDFIYYYRTTRLAEKPFNIIIRKEKLKELATRHFIVRKEDYELLR